MKKSRARDSSTRSTASRLQQRRHESERERPGNPATTARKKHTRKRATSPSNLDAFWPSHTPFGQILDFPVLPSNAPPYVRDHVAELSALLSYDTDRAFWFHDATKEGIYARKILYRLGAMIHEGHDVNAAEAIYAMATYASFEVMLLYLRQPELFNSVAARCNILPCLASIHPNTSKVMAAMRKDAPLGKLTPESGVINSRAWFTSNKPANVYARAIIDTIRLNQRLEPIQQQKKTWDRFDKLNHCKTHLLPFPAYIEGIDDLPRELSQGCVLQYWRKGKQIILEEMPDFHLRPEWHAYAERHYENGAKTGAIQHAIFRDILTALRLMAGSRRSR